VSPICWIQTANGGRVAGRIVSWDATELVYVANLRIAPTRRVSSADVDQITPVTETSLPVKMRLI
jgi:hypothetical protein